MAVVTMHITEEEREDLKKIVEQMGFVTVTAWLRQFIRENKAQIIKTEEKKIS